MSSQIKGKENFNFKDRVGEVSYNRQGCKMTILNYRGTCDIDIQFEDNSITYNKRYSHFKTGNIKKYEDRLYKRQQNKLGEWMTIVRYKDSQNVDVQFDCGTIAYSKMYDNFLKGSIKKPSMYVGETCISKEGYELKIIMLRRSDDIDILVDNKYIEYNREYCEFTRGSVTNVYHPSVNGVGYFGVGAYNSSKYKSIYNTWSNMLDRCYNKKSSQYHMYGGRGVKVSEEWHNFQNFAKWFEYNYNHETMEGWQIDKDIMCPECLLYSESTSRFVPAEINMLFRKGFKESGFPKGVDRKGNKFQARIRLDGIEKYLGLKDTIEEAFLLYKFAFEEKVKNITLKYKNTLEEDIYLKLINYNLVQK